jgi:hypothetical protein
MIQGEFTLVNLPLKHTACTVSNELILHSAGDTAQSISKDSLFRFATAKALFYTHFSDPSNNKKQSEVVPDLLPLSYNYRSHRGILSVASVVMDLLYAGTEIHNVTSSTQ